MKKFLCKSCGNCCRDFGLLGTLPLFEEEKKRLEDLGKELNVELKFIPENLMIEKNTGAVICSNWGLVGNPCPFLDEKNLCKIYSNRALICKSFPLYKIPKNKNFNLGCFMQCPNFNHKKFLESGLMIESIYKKNSIEACREIQRRQQEISEKIIFLISSGTIDLEKIDSYDGEIISAERFLEIAGMKI